MTAGSRPRTRFVPTLTEVVKPVDSVMPATAAVSPSAPAPELVQEAVSPVGTLTVQPSRSMLEATVDDLMPQARERLRESLHAAAYTLAEEQLRSMEDDLRQRLRLAVREAAGMGKKGVEVAKD